MPGRVRCCAIWQQSPPAEERLAPVTICWRPFLASEGLLCNFLAFSSMSRYAFSTVYADIYAWRARANGPGSSAIAPLSPFACKLLRGYKKLFPPGLNKCTPLGGAQLLTFMEALIYEESRMITCYPDAPASDSLQAAMLTSSFVTGPAFGWAARHSCGATSCYRRWVRTFCGA